MTLPKVYSRREKLSMSGFIKKKITIDYTMFICERLISPITAALRRGHTVLDLTSIGIKFCMTL